MRTSNYIFISRAVWHEIAEKVDYDEIEKLLRDINVSSYGDVLGINFFYICMEKLNSEDEDKVEYDSKERHINITRILDYDAVKIMNPEQIRQYMIVKFINSIDAYKKLEIDFDIVQFKQDIEDRLLVAN